MSKAVNTLLRDQQISHAIGVRRLSTGVVNDITDLLNAADADVVRQIERLDPTSVAARYQRDRLNRLLSDLRGLNKEVYSGIGSTLKGQLKDIAQYEAGFQAVRVGSVLGAELAVPTREMLTSLVTQEPFQGRLLGEWVQGLEAGRYARLRDAVRMGLVEGESIGQMVARVRGTPQLNYKDGVLATSKRSAEAMVRTAVVHTATQAKQLTYEENKDILDGWRFVSTLEPRTCMVCAALDDGVTVWPIGEGPYPPRHINCRCTTVPVIKGGGSTDKISFNKWLAEQDADVVEDTLGATRARLYLMGRLAINKFADDNRVITLEQLRKLEPDAFRRARIGEALPARSLGAADPADAATELEKATAAKWAAWSKEHPKDLGRSLFNEYADTTATVDSILASVAAENPGIYKAVAAARKRLEGLVTTDTKFTHGGTWQPDRELLHKAIVEHYMTAQNRLRALPQANTAPTLSILGGRGGSGKSFFTSSRPSTGGAILDQTKAIKIDSDEIKAMLGDPKMWPEGINTKDWPVYEGWNAGAFHEESSYIVEKVLFAAKKAKTNVILDVTMKSVGGIQTKLDEFAKAGYNVDGYYMFAPPQEAARRAMARFTGESGRFVPPEYVLSSTTNEQTFDTVKDRFRHWEVYEHIELGKINKVTTGGKAR